MVVWVEVVVTGMGPDGGAGVAPIVYRTLFPPPMGGDHTMVTVASPIPCMELLTITSRGGPEEIGRTQQQ